MTKATIHGDNWSQLSYYHVVRGHRNAKSQCYNVTQQHSDLYAALNTTNPATADMGKFVVRVPRAM